MQNTLSILLAILTILLTGCSTLVTSFEYYDIVEDEASPFGESRTEVTAEFMEADPITKTLFPLIYEKEMHKDPFTFGFAIWGDFQEIKSVKAHLIIDGQPQAQLKVDISKMNNGKIIHSRGSRPRFSSFGFVQDFLWDDIEQVEFEIKFTAIDKKGNLIEHSEKKVFRKTFDRETGNRIWFNIMSV